MPFLLDGNPTQSEISDAVNYLLSNFSANISSDPNNGQITGSGGQIIGYLYKYMMVKYADSFDGSVNFSNTQTNRLYYGLRNDDSSTESTNPADYIWYKVAGGGFSTTKTLYYKVTGGRSIEFNVGTTSPGYAWVPDTGSAIDLDALTMAFTVNAIIYKWDTSTAPARPTSTTTYNWITSSYTAPSGWSTSIPSGGTFGSYLWSITILVTQTGGIDSTVLDWTNVAYPIVAVGINGQNGTNGLVAYLAQSQASPTPAFSSSTSGPNAPSGWSLVAPSVAVGQVLWYIQGQYNSSTTDTVNGVPPNTTNWTGPIAASVFQDIRSDNWNGSSPPTAGNPATYGTQGYYIQRTTGSAYLNNLYARGEITVGSSPEISGTTMTGSGTHLYSDGRFVLGNSSKNVTFDNSNLYMNGFANATTASTVNLSVTGTPQTILTFSSGKQVPLIYSQDGDINVIAPITPSAPYVILGQLDLRIYDSGGTLLILDLIKFAMPPILYSDGHSSINIPFGNTNLYSFPVGTYYMKVTAATGVYLTSGAFYASSTVSLTCNSFVYQASI